MRKTAKMLASRAASNRTELEKAQKALKEDLAIAFPEILAYDVTSKALLIHKYLIEVSKGMGGLRD